MYAVVQSGGKQYRVAEGQTVKLEKLASEPGDVIDIAPVLMIHGGEDNIAVGAPYVESGKVQAEVIGHGRHKKIKIIKFRRRKHHMKRMGHRQDYTEVKITKVEL